MSIEEKQNVNWNFRAPETQGNTGRLRSLLDSALDAIITADRGGSIIDWNPAAERMFGYERAEAVGQPLDMIIPERYRNAHRAGLSRAGSGGRCAVSGRTVEVAALRKDGTEFPVEMSLAVWEENGERNFTGIVRDISARVAAKEALMMAQAQLLESEGLAAASEVIAGVLHEINTPLAALCSMADTATALYAREERELSGKSARRHAMAAQLPRAMAECASRIREVVEALGGLVRLDSSEHGLQDIREALDGALMLLATKLANIEVVREGTEDSAFVHCHAARINRAIATLLKHAANSGAEVMRVALSRDDHAVRLTIEDDGVGISQEDIRRAFSPSLGENDGRMRLQLGLASAKNAIEDAGGTVQMSALSRGTRVVVKLPLAGAGLQHDAVPNCRVRDLPLAVAVPHGLCIGRNVGAEPAVAVGG
jgi:PAS domain S-box-containing protein